MPPRPVSGADIDLALDPYFGTRTLTASNADNYTNSGGTTASIVLNGNSGTEYTLSGSVVGDIKTVITFTRPETGTMANNSRVVFSSTSNTITGGIEVNYGIVRFGDALQAGTGTLTLNQGTVMPSAEITLNNDIILADGSWGGFRPSGAITLTGNISGGGDLLMMLDGGRTVTLNSPAGTAEASRYTYGGTTGIGVYRENGSTNTAVVLRLGQSYLLPQTTVVEIGKSRNDAYTYESTGSSLQLNNTTQNIAGLYGIGNLTGGAAATSILNINVSNATSSVAASTLAFSGAISNSTLNISGDGAQIISGGLTGSNINVAMTGDGFVRIGGATNAGTSHVTVTSGLVETAQTAGTTWASSLVIQDGGAVRVLSGITHQQLVSGTATINAGGLLDVNGGNFRANTLVLNGDVTSAGGRLEIGTTGINSFTGAGTITGTDADNPFVVQWGYATTTEHYYLQAMFDGNLQFVKQGGGRIYTTQDLTHSGGTRIESGIIYANHQLGTGDITFINGTTLMVGGTSLEGTDEVTHANNIVLEGNGNLRIGGATGRTLTITYSGDISGTGMLRFNDGESATSSANFVMSGANSDYSGGTEFAGSGAYTVVAASDNAFGTGDITVTNTRGSVGATLQFDSSAGDRTIANDIDLNGRYLAFTQSGDNDAFYAGNLSGAGNLTSTGVDFVINLDDFFVSPDAVNAIWSDLTATLELNDATIFLTSDDWESLVGAEFSIFDGASITGISKDSFSLLDVPGGLNVDWTPSDLAGGAFGISINGTFATPEPATWVLMLMAAAGVLAVRRKRAAAV